MSGTSVSRLEEYLELSPSIRNLMGDTKREYSRVFFQIEGIDERKERARV